METSCDEFQWYILLYSQNTLKLNTGILTAFLMIALLWYRNGWAKVETGYGESQKNRQHLFLHNSVEHWTIVLQHACASAVVVHKDRLWVWILSLLQVASKDDGKQLHPACNIICVCMCVH